MRLLGLALSAALLSGCSFVGAGSGGYAGHGNGANAYGPRYGGPAGAANGFADPCQIAHAQAAVPQGCHPSQVSIGVPTAGGANFAGGFAQTPQFGAPAQFGAELATGHYGSHADVQGRPGLRGAKVQRKRKPRFRGALDLGVERSVGGTLLDYSTSGVADPTANYNPYVYTEGRDEGETVSGTLISTRFFGDSREATRRRRASDGSEFLVPDPANPGAFIVDPNVQSFDALAPYDVVNTPTISFDDVWSTPATVGLSGEYILNNRATVFGRVGYAMAEGRNGAAASISGTVYQEVSAQEYDELGDPIGAPVVTQSFLPDQTTFATFGYDFSDMRRLDLEAGGRLYIDPIAGRASGRTVTPFVSASAGASHYNAVTFKTNQTQLSYGSAFEGEPELYRVTRNPALGDDPTTQLYDSQWVPTGRLAVGAEWQVTPRTALAFETGVKVDGKREYSNGNKGSSNVSVPVTLRGSFNF